MTKVSKLMQEIIRLAEDKFGVSKHDNDIINITIDSAPGFNWQLSLVRPSQRQLDFGEVTNSESCKLAEYRTAFYVVAPTLVEALHQLKAKVKEADYVDFQA